MAKPSQPDSTDKSKTEKPKDPEQTDRYPEVQAVLDRWFEGGQK